MITSKDDMSKIKVEISLTELCELREKAEFYFQVAEERDRLYKELYELKHKEDKNN
jgi:hypothetical protein